MKEKSNYFIDTAVLLIIFNRPSNTRQVFEAIRRSKPKKLFIAADGPRNDVPGEVERCNEARQIALNIDWDCEAKTLFREKNIGCKKAVSSGIDWFFQYVDEGIILEDDCVPNSSFFSFCQQMLFHYRNDTRILMVSGTNYLSKEHMDIIATSYFFSDYYPIWGWATWKRAWNLYDVEMRHWNQFQLTNEMEYLFPYKAMSLYYQHMFNLIRKGFDTWDIQWWFTCIFNHGLAIVPKYNLISNTGDTGTHSNTQGTFYLNMPTYDMDLKQLVHPKYIFPDKRLNELTYTLSHAQLVLKETSAQQIKKRVKHIIKRLSGKKT